MARRKRPGAARPKRPAKGAWPVIVVVAALCLAVYWPARPYDFVWDDLPAHLGANQELMTSNHAYFWRHAYQDFYIPVTYSTWIWQKDLGGVSRDGEEVLRPEIFRTANLILHAANTALVLYLLLLLGSSAPAATLGAIVFAIHPLQVEPVVWISEYRGLLAAFFSFAAVAAYCRSRQRASRPRVWLTVATAMFVLALLSKPSIVGLPLVVAAIDTLLPGDGRPRWHVPLAWLFIALPMMIATKLAQPDSALDVQTPLFLRPLVAADAVNHYLMKAILPYPLSASYGRTPTLVAHMISTYVFWIVPVVLALVAWKVRRRSPIPWICGVVIVASLLPVLGFVPFKGQNFSTVADRYFYVGMFGVALAIAFAAMRFERNKIFWTATVAVLVTFLWTNRTQQRVWEDDLTLFGHAARTYPNQARVHNNYGVALQIAGRQDEAIAQFDIAIRVWPSYADAYCNRGSSRGRLKRFDEALRDQTRALELDPTDGGCAYNRAVTEYSMGRSPEALADVQRATSLGYRVPQEFEEAVRRKLGR